MRNCIEQTVMDTGEKREKGESKGHWDRTRQGSITFDARQFGGDDGLELGVTHAVSVNDDLRGQLAVVAALEHRQEA